MEVCIETENVFFLFYADNNSAHKRKRNGSNEHSKKWCCKENRATDVALTRSTSSASKSALYRTTAHSKGYWDPVTAGGTVLIALRFTRY